jgi:hypothetical protein
LACEGTGIAWLIRTMPCGSLMPKRGDCSYCHGRSKIILIRISDIVPWRCAFPPAVRMYAAMLRAGHNLRPIHVNHRGGLYEIQDGMHRARAAKRVGRKTIAAHLIWW